LRASDPPRATGEHARRVLALPQDRWFFGLPAPLVSLCSLEDRASADLAADVREVLRLLANEGLGPLVALDIAPEGALVSVVRVVAPSLETTALDGRLRAKARASFNPFSLVRGAHDSSLHSEGSRHAI